MACFCLPKQSLLASPPLFPRQVLSDAKEFAECVEDIALECEKFGKIKNSAGVQAERTGADRGKVRLGTRPLL